jgi:regulatory Fis family protein
MPKHIEEIAKRLLPSHPASLGSSAIHVVGVGRLVGYTLATVEAQFIVQTLRHFQGNRTHSANALGISVRSLRDRIRVYREQGENVPGPQTSNADHSLHVSEFCHRSPWREPKRKLNTQKTPL